MKDLGDKTRHVSEYLELLSKQVDPVTAASRAFGDLKELQKELESYIRNSDFHYLKMMPRGRRLRVQSADSQRGAIRCRAR